MQIDANNNVVKLCAKGMDLEGQGQKKEALELFQQAWNQVTNDFEKFTSEHLEDLNDFTNARKNYELALSHVGRLPDNGYGNLIKAGIMNGIERVK